MSEIRECVLFRPPKTNKKQRQKIDLAERAVDVIRLGMDLKTSNRKGHPEGAE